MNADGWFAGYAEIRNSANRIRTVHLALRLALLDAALAPCRELLRQRRRQGGEDRRDLNSIANGAGHKKAAAF